MTLLFILSAIRELWKRNCFLKLAVGCGSSNYVNSMILCGRKVCEKQRQLGDVVSFPPPLFSRDDRYFLITTACRMEASLCVLWELLAGERALSKLFSWENTFLGFLSN